MPKSLKWHLLALAGFTVLTLFMTLPVIFSLTSHVAGAGGDPWQTMWRFEDTWRRVQITAQSARAADVTQFMRDEFFGSGEPRLVNLSAWPWLWMHALFGQPAAYNAVWLASFILSGFSMYALVWWLTADGRASFLAGVAYMFLPFHVAQAQGHWGAMQLQWLPLAALASAAFVRLPSMGRALLLTVVLVAQAWTEHHYMLWLALLAVPAAFFFWADVRRFFSSRIGLPTAAVVAALLFFFIWLPYWPTVRLAVQSRDALSLGAAQTIRFSADLFAYVTPAGFHPILGGLSTSLFGQNFTGNISEATHYLGLLPLLLVLFFFRDLPARTSRFWLCAAIVFILVSFGPRLHLLGRITGLALPWALVDQLPVFNAVRTVARASAVVGLAWMVLFGMVLAKQLHSRGSALVILLIMLLEFLFMPAVLQAAALPRAYEKIADMPGQSLIEIPAATNYVIASRGLYGALYHGKLLVGNSALERGDIGEDDAIALPMLRQLLFLRTQHLREDRPEFFAQEPAETLADVMRWLDARIVLLHRDSLTLQQLEAMEHILLERLHLQREGVDDVYVYTAAADLKGDGVFAARDEGWQHVGFDFKRQTTFGEVPKQARLVLYNVEDAEITVAMSWRLAEKSEGSLTVLYGDEVVATARQSGDDVYVRLSLPPGKSELTLRNDGSGRVIIQDPVMRVLPSLRRNENTNY